MASGVEHLGLPAGAWTTRRVRPRAEELEAAGLLERYKQLGYIYWGLTPSGRDHLDLIRPDIGLLPESPQHRHWRETHALAGKRIGEVRDALRVLLEEAEHALKAGSRTDSDTWFEFSRRLRKACDRLASVTHCLYEWPEPDDAHADIDPGTRRPDRRWSNGWDECY